ncbi:DUF2911 domain-containing protein [Sphingobacterium rhinopitheci]|uniref:DUF2911 domain-containing protein n=1 Tax=Sphingobacterium rhinopitheci TaxID=2781960 RepID=UPI001F52980A|nr:DUF2911 domain-containing protein [Sphingobacterium rhinopitheci]MCI0920478.1 DUF2911 domain-containing protein [Sphingobacterium rhinopitheci]
MKKIILSIATAGLLFLGTETTSAQVKLPQASSTQSVTQGLGIKTISLIYQRPNVNGRTIFGGLIPYNEVWRTGANNIPSITFQEEVTIEGNKVPAGTYGIFTIPTATNWTIILSKNVNQWGAYQYKQEEDFLRFTVPSHKLNDKVETFTMQFEDVTTKSTKLTLAWDKTKVGFTIVADQSKEISASIEQAMTTDKKPYFQAAQYYYNNNLDSKKAAEWIKAADEGNTKAAHIKYWKARILTKAGDKAGAQKAAQEGIAMAKEANNAEYVKLNTEALNAAK